MGANNSKPGSSTQHVFASSTPIQFSQELIDSLQASSETNSTRAKSLDLHIAQRVAAELEKLTSASSSALEIARQKLASDSESSSADKPSSILPRSSAQKEEDARKAQTSKSVADEIEKLKTTLSQRKILKELPKDVEKARDSVIACLRVNDRRPLDCWKEVEAFKSEVRRLEEKFVGDVL